MTPNNRPEDINHSSALVQIYFSNDPWRAGMNGRSLAAGLSNDLLLSQINPQFWRSDNMFIQVLEDPGLHDTSLFRWGINAVEPEGNGWQELNELIRSKLVPIASSLRAFWGITLVYQARCPALDCGSNIDITPLIASALPLQDRRPETPKILASEPIPGGALWLTSISNSGDGLDAANIYIALANKSGDDNQLDYFIRQPLFSEQDLIAQKAYFERREYVNKIKNNGFSQKIEHLRESTSEILNTKEITIEGTSTRLDELAKNYDTLLDDFLWLDGLKISLAQQRLHLSNFLENSHENGIWRFHSRHIESYAQELEIQSNHIAGLLESAGQAVNIANSRVEKEKEKQRQRFERLIAFLGTALAIPQLITFETVDRILIQYGKTLASPVILIIQVLITLICAYLISSIVNRLSTVNQSRTTTVEKKGELFSPNSTQRK